MRKGVQPPWIGPTGAIVEAVREQSERCLAAYREDPNRVLSDANLEITTAEGGYGRKQIYELIQNGADALLGQPGRIEVVLTTDMLYVANQGATISEDGIDALLGSHLSKKRASEIGRFGLGFKSVVAVSDRPQIFSRSGSFGFDRATAERRIKEIVPSAKRYPLLRLAEPLDPAAEARADSDLAQLMKWATTVVRLPLKARQHLSDDLSTFPAEFLLFSPHVTELDVHDREAGTGRWIRQRQDPSGDLLLEDGPVATRWRVVQRAHRPSAAAARDAGELTNREEITLNWAVPMQNRTRVGQFWAFFPTESQTTLSGIINAPWKLSDDRRNLLEGVFNQEVLSEVLPQLISDSLPDLVATDDPSAVLDLLPARGREHRNWADRDINTPIFDRLSQSLSVPDLTGVLRRPVDLRLHPKGLDSDWLEGWRSLPSHRAGWVHHDVDRSPERRLKAERLMGNDPKRQSTVSEWLEALCSPSSLEASAVAVDLVARIAEASSEFRDAARSARVLLLEDGRLVAPKVGTVFVRASKDETGYDFIDPGLAKLAGVKASLAKLGIQVLDRSGELRNALSQSDSRRVEWERVWSLCRQLPEDVAADILRESLSGSLDKSLMVRNAEGRWVPMGTAFLGGGVIPLDGSRDRAFLIDPRYHQADGELLRELGAVTQPSLRRNVAEESWLAAYKDSMIEQFIAKAAGSKPARDRVTAEGPQPPWPLDSLSRLSPEGRMAVTEVALMLDSGESWVVRHQTNASYGKTKYRPPVYWWVRKHGMLKTRLGPWPVAQCLRPDRGIPDDVLPVADVSSLVADRLKLLEDAPELPEVAWRKLLVRATKMRDQSQRTALYSYAVYYVEAPPTIRVTVGQRTLDVSPRDVACTSDPEVHRSLLEQQTPCLLLAEEDDVAALIKKWGLAEGSRLLQQELVAAPTGEPVPLVDLYPPLRLFLDASAAALELQLCDSVDLVTATPRGQVSRPVPGALVDGQVLVTADEPKAQLAQISNALKLGLTADDIRSVLDQQQRQRTNKLVSQLRAAGSTEERIALAVGPDALRRSIPATALAAIQGSAGRELEGPELAALAHAVHGVAILQHFKSVLEERGLTPPVQWAGRAAARRFVNDLGFPTDYAGFSSDRRPAVFDVDGPAVLGPLHDYQVVVTERIKQLLGGHGAGRGLVSLPTGAGKTRVAVQALVDEIREGRLDGPIIWIAQSDELCEQAVQTWAYVWRAIGPRERMAISRFWSNNEMTEESDAFQLVVATIDKLGHAANKPQYEWLSGATVVVVDEAHSSIAPSYTSVLDWLGRGRSRADRRPLIGLTATPFRNTNVDETERLASRYDKNRLDSGAFEGDPYDELQERGVLAQVEHEVLDGVDVNLTVADLAEIDKYKRLPSSVESRLGEDLDRNRRIVRSVANLPSDWPVLLFATSVESARALAAQLTHEGVHSVAISADTEPAARRHYIEQFQSGTLRVITNYGVLAQGFDAPAVRAVYVTRPTFSTNLYQQMIGRGLRGPRNGGSEKVRIVNVRDNLQQYGDRLAFYDFEHLWSAPVG